ncbi:MAG: hydroxypyruvate isomerase [Rhizobiales bacterium]|nr:hydroxypyruvate isomerase [Hyphomicrobiales bacterium]
MPKFSANLNWLFTDLPFMDRFAAAKAAGFNAVEFMAPYDYDLGELVEAHSAAKLDVILHNMPMGDWDKGERGYASFPDRIADFRDSVALTIENASALKCPRVNCMSGITPDGADINKMRAVLVENLGYAAAEFAKHGITLLAEAINTRDMPGFFLNTSSQAFDLMKEVGSDNFLFQYDIYHMQIMEGDLANTLSENIDKIGHIQLADNPGRHEPGTGEINYPFVLKHLDDIGYQGWVGCEYAPSGDTVETLGWIKPLW